MQFCHATDCHTVYHRIHRPRITDPPLQQTEGPVPLNSFRFGHVMKSIRPWAHGTGHDGLAHSRAHWHTYSGMPTVPRNRAEQVETRRHNEHPIVAAMQQINADMQATNMLQLRQIRRPPEAGAVSVKTHFPCTTLPALPALSVLPCHALSASAMLLVLHR